MQQERNNALRQKLDDLSARPTSIVIFLSDLALMIHLFSMCVCVLVLILFEMDCFQAGGCCQNRQLSTTKERLSSQLEVQDARHALEVQQLQAQVETKF